MKMHILKKRSFIFFLIITMLSVVCVLFASLGIYVYQNKFKGKEPKAADLEISTYNNLRDFSAAVSNGNSYSGKTVVLKNSIDCKGSSLSCIGSGTWNSFSGGTINRFNGTFDGQGFTIYNFTLIGGAQFQTRTIKGQKEYNFYYYYHMGLFVDIGSSATIKNVKISSYDFDAMDHVNTPSSGRHSYYHYNKHFGLVSNYNTNGTISQCWVASGSGYQSVSTVKNVMLTNSIINSSGGTITSPNITNGIDASSTGGSIGTTWYYAADYNDGWPVLRIFITKSPGWKEVSFSVAGGTTPSSIYIPYDANSTFSSSTASVKIYGQTVSSSSSYCHYITAGWRAKNATNYSLVFSLPIREINIKIYNETTKITEVFKNYSVTCGSSIAVTLTEYNGSSKYKACTISGYEYTPVSTYYISSIDCSNGTVIHSDKDITITIKQKTYDVTFN